MPLLSLLPAWGQTAAPGFGKDKLKAAPQAATPQSAGTSTAARAVGVAKGADGKWKCAGPGGRACSDQERQAVVTVTKTLSNIKNNLTVGPDGTLQCTAAGKPCLEAEMQNAAAELSKAITKGGLGY